MAKMEESLETRLTRTVKVRYLNQWHKLGHLLPAEPFSAIQHEWFRAIFASAAHEEGLCYHKGKLTIDLTPDQREERRMYVRTMVEVQKRLKVALKRLDKNKRETPTIDRSRVIREETFPPPTQSEPVQTWLIGFAPRERAPEHIRTRLAKSREELASRMNRC